MQKPVVVGLEPTGNYHRVLAHRLIAAGFSVRLISSMALARTREALHNGWDKNDPKDAQVILHMLGIGATMIYQDPLAAGINDLQELSKTHEVVSKAKTEIWHRLLTHYLPLYFPEIERFVGNLRSDWFLSFLERFPTPASIAAMPNVNAGEKMHRWVEVKMHHDGPPAGAQLSSSIDEPAFPSRPADRLPRRAA